MLSYTHVPPITLSTLRERRKRAAAATAVIYILIYYDAVHRLTMWYNDVV